jgi:dipeptidyl aminopeptidase/acylaminoacyl peptidase
LGATNDPHRIIPAKTNNPPTSTTSTKDYDASPKTEPVDMGLQPDAPWLIISTKTGLWAANMDGTNLISLLKKSYLSINLHRAVSSPAHQIAVLTSGKDYYHGLALNLISLPNGKVKKITNLSTPDTEPEMATGPGDPALEAMRAISEEPSYAWSPDGKKLAFIGALDEPKADLYIYDLANQNIQRVSQDDGQDYLPSWSPDGKYILYFEAESFGTGAGSSMKGAWVAAADGSGAELLYTPKSSGEHMYGWRDDETAVLSSWDPGNGTTRLRLFNIHTRQQTTLVNGKILAAAVSTGASTDDGAILYATDNGLYLLPGGSKQSQKITSKSTPVSIHWQDIGRMFVVQFEDGSLSTFSSDGLSRQDAPFNISNGLPETCSYGLIWGWTNRDDRNNGVWISGPGLETIQILDQPASAPIWNIDNDLLFFVGQDLYITTFNSHYDDVMPMSSLTGEVIESAWLGFDEAFDKKYSP